MNARVEARYVGSSMNPLVLRRNPLPEIIFLGRSNVGKSSLINCLLGQKGLARTSSTPGKTRLFFFYEVDEKLLFVDPPGYGYAKVAETVRTRWMKEMERYFRKSDTLMGVVQVMDARHAPTPIDLDMARWLAESQIPTVYALNKSDKLTRSKLAEAMRRAGGELSFPGAGQTIAFSTVNKDGRKELWGVLDKWRAEEKLLHGK
jgi:GTP-binding protein